MSESTIQTVCTPLHLPPLEEGSILIHHVSEVPMNAGHKDKGCTSNSIYSMLTLFHHLAVG